uniref:Chemosensory protein 13 n=1 Tax=Matsumurasca onukii TaxID=2912585 RepID=A0A343WH08_MATON|nr:chemosensory protein 13 [Matsumurasca onukii]
MYVALVLMMVAVAVAQDKYTTKYDGVNIDQILQNDRLLTSYFNCIMDKGKCSPDGQELKKHIPDALENECAKCSDKQKAGVEKVLRFLYEKKPDLFKEMEAKYDSEGKYRLKYKDRAEREFGIKV